MKWLKSSDWDLGVFLFISYKMSDCVEDSQIFVDLRSPSKIFVQLGKIAFYHFSL